METAIANVSVFIRNFIYIHTKDGVTSKLIGELVTQNRRYIMLTIIGAGDVTTGYDVENSLRFNLVDDTDLVQTFGSGNRRTWTF